MGTCAGATPPIKCEIQGHIRKECSMSNECSMSGTCAVKDSNACYYLGGSCSGKSAEQCKMAGLCSKDATRAGTEKQCLALGTCSIDTAKTQPACDTAGTCSIKGQATAEKCA